MSSSQKRPPDKEQPVAWKLTRYQTYAFTKPFTFYVGPELEEFILPASLVAEQSPKLRALVYNGMKESREMKVIWEVEDREAFMMFGDFCHSGIYDFEPIADNSDDPLLIHAKVFMLADYNQIEHLRTMAFEHLRTGLFEMRLWDDNIHTFIGLVDYVLKNTVQGCKYQDQARDLVLQYCEKWYDYLMDVKDFRDLLETPGVCVSLLKKIRPPRGYEYFASDQGT